MQAWFGNVQVLYMEDMAAAHGRHKVCCATQADELNTQELKEGANFVCQKYKRLTSACARRRGCFFARSGL